MPRQKSIIPKESSLSCARQLRLDNGLQVFVREKGGSPTVSVQLWVKTGSIHEGADMGCGLSHFLEHMLFQGTKKYPGLKVADTVNQLGGHINAYTSYGCTVYYIDILSAHMDKAVDMLSDMVAAPLFPARKFLSEKDVILRERDMGLDNPSRMLSEKTWLNMFLNHPARHPIIGYKEKIAEVDRAVMERYYRRRYSPFRSFFVVCGDVDAEDVFASVRKSLGSWAPGDISERPLPEEPEQACPRRATYHFNDPLARVSLNFMSRPSNHPDVPALDILSSILGLNKSSRLVESLKTDKKLAINISSYNYTPYFAGVFGVSAMCKPENLEPLLAGVRSEIAALKKNGALQQELDREIQVQKADYIRSLRSNSAVARILGNTILSFGGPEYADWYIPALEKVTLDDVSRVLSQYLDENRLTTVEMLPEEPKKKAAPKDRAAGDDTLPSMRKLPGGQRVITLRDDSLPMIDLCLALPGGTVMESEAESGVTRLIASALHSGTRSMSEKKLSRLLDDNAIDLSVSSGDNTLLVKMNFLADKLDTALSIFESVLAEPAFGGEEFERERRNALECLRSRALNPQNAAEDRLCEMLYGSHPYSRPPEGLLKSLDKITAGAARSFYLEKCLCPEKAVLAACGDFDPAKMSARLGKILAAIPWSKRKFAPPPRPVFPSKSASGSVKIPRQQSVVMCGFPSCDSLSPDRFPTDLLQQAMNGMTSSLFKEIREKEGLAYYTGLVSSRGIHEGFLSLYAGTEPKAASKVAKIMEAERLKIARNGLSKKEFEAARECLLHMTAEQFQDKGSMIASAALSEFYGNGFMSPWEAAEIYKNMDFKKTNAAIKRIMGARRTVTVVAGP